MMQLACNVLPSPCEATAFHISKTLRVSKLSTRSSFPHHLPFLQTSREDREVFPADDRAPQHTTTYHVIC
jgi:hypothetical protein